MIPRITLVLIACLALLSGRSQARQKTALGSDSLIDIDIDEPRQGEEVVPGSGSGATPLPSDDEDLATSGSGSGSGGVPAKSPGDKLTPSVETTTPFKPRTPCEQLRESSIHLIVGYVPRCTQAGAYDSLQCQGYPGTGECWCADLAGAKIPGTYKRPPAKPDCENGTNLEACIFQLVKFSRSGQLGLFRPHCTATGDFEEVQCLGSVCYCVSPQGKRIDGTEVYKPDMPVCEPRSKPTTKAPTPTTTEGRINRPDMVYTVVPVDKGDGVVQTLKPVDETMEVATAHPPVEQSPDIALKPPVKPEGGDTGGDTGEKEGENETGPKEGTGMESKTPVHDHRDSPAAQIMTQPGLLAAIIGGAVVGLLCAVLLVMFLVYRMRKKDEGSYALDEPRRMPNYPYTRAPDKEFYA